MRLTIILAVVVVLCVAVGLRLSRISDAHLTPAPDSEPVRSLSAAPPRPYLLVRSTRADVSFGKLLLVPLYTADGTAFETSLFCDRAAFAGSRGVCLTLEGDTSATPYAYVFNERFETLHKIRLAGVPNRLRVSPSGRHAAISVQEHTHHDPVVDFVARTIIVETGTGNTIDLDTFRLTTDGRPLRRRRHLGIWGVTFAADGNRFFATLELETTKYLLEGDVAAGTARVLRRGIECPSLSPDNKRIVYKRRLHVDDDARLRVYELDTGADRPIDAEPRSIVDQVDWLDNDRLIYHLSGPRGSDVWTVRLDGTEPARILRPYAYSPAVVR